MTTTGMGWSLAVALAVLSVRASAHEVDCSKLAAIALRDQGGGPLLDPSGLPSLAAPPSVVLTVDHYPALVAFDVRIRNLAAEPSVLSSVDDTLPADPGRIRAFGDALAGTIPVGGALHRAYTVEIRSFADCLTTFPVDPTLEAPVCGLSRENPLVVTTESNIATCRARVQCAPQVVGPPPPPVPPPSVCVAPTWTGDLVLPLQGVAFAFGDTVGCDGVTWLAGSHADPLVVTTSVGAVFRVDPAGQLSLFRLDDTANAVRVDGRGFLDVAGHRLVGTVSGAGASVRQFDQVGALRWEYDAADFLPSSGPASGGVDADVDGSSNVYFAYQTSATGRGTEIAVVKLTPDGGVVWTTLLGTDADDGFGHLAVTPDGGVFVAGSTSGTFPGQVSAGGQDAFLARLDPADGHLVWVRQLGTAGADLGAAVAAGQGGGPVALVGATPGPLDGGAPSTSSDAFVAVFDGAGALQWIRELRATPALSIPPGATATSAAAVAIDSTGAVWVGGSATGGNIPGATFSGFGADGFVARYDASGTYLWGRQYGGGGSSITALTLDAAGSAIASENQRGGLTLRLVHAIRISPDGT